MTIEKNLKGAGRKPLPEHLKKVKLHDFRLPEWIVEWLLSHKGKASQLLEEAIINYFHLSPTEEFIMQNAIRQILTTIQPNHIFDSHFVIDQLIANFSDEYIRFVSQYANGGQPTVVAHGHIGQIISGFSGELVEQLEQKAWSKNIHGNASECTCWRKL